MGCVVRFGIMPWTSTPRREWHMHPTPQLSGGDFWTQCLGQAPSGVCTVGAATGLRAGEGRPWSTGWTGRGWRAASDRPLKGREPNRSLDALIFQKHHSGLCVEGLGSGGDFGGCWVLEVVAQDRASFLCKLGCAPGLPPEPLFSLLSRPPMTVAGDRGCPGCVGFSVCFYFVLALLFICQCSALSPCACPLTQLGFFKLPECFFPFCYILPDYTQLSHLHVILPKPLTLCFI